MNKSIATRIWNKNTLETFGSAWEARKQRNLQQFAIEPATLRII
ncbi:hypothetical protein [Chamaesiphon sp.]